MNVNLTASNKLTFYLEGVYSLAEGSFDPFDLPVPEDIPSDVHISPDFDGDSTADYDFSKIGEFSDLDYTTLEGTVGLNYKLDAKASLYGSVNLVDLQDDQTYVYGDLTGNIITYAAGMTVGF